MREWMASDAANRREDLFIGSKIGPGGACWPLGYNESINQARMILGYYNSLPPVSPAPNITQLDLLLVHWPVNYGPCPQQPGKGTIPTTDPLCDANLPAYLSAGLAKIVCSQRRENKADTQSRCIQSNIRLAVAFIVITITAFQRKSDQG